MDPDANLKEQLEIVERMQKRQDEFKEDEHTWGFGDVLDWHKEQSKDGERLAELVKALNEWIVTGGFFPQPWHDVLLGKVLT
jgi:hypothetical protein